jgi:hypothetical protein
MKRFIVSMTVFCLIIAACQVILSLQWKVEKQGRSTGIPRVSVCIPDPDLYMPGREIREVQPYLKIDPVLGFLWKENLDSSDNVRFTWGDQEPCLLSTDQWGFINSPEAIAEQKAKKKVEIIGLGASFMQGASSAFYDFFSLHGLLYYNMATHRHTLPQFNDALKRNALPIRPSWIIYELNEASPSLINDYLAWKRSGLDWFTYHSGTWSGPPKSSQYDLGPLKKIPEINGIAVAVLKKVLPKKTVFPGTFEEQKKLCLEYICAADSMTRQAGSRMIVLYIPSKETIFYGRSRISGLIDGLLPMLSAKGITVLDLRKPFNDSDDPRSLYYAVDGHWNKDGVLMAARAVKAVMDSVGRNPPD